MARHSSIAFRLKKLGGHPSGFDFMRIFLAVTITFVHCLITSGGFDVFHQIFSGWTRPFARWLVPAFFALSGFLVAGSLERSKTLGMFLGLRAIRIYPALAIEVIISALIIGPFVTTSSISAYFSDPNFWIYLRNMYGDIHYHLPGVFANNPNPDTVNAQLWTIPFELGCYIAITGITLLGLRRKRILGPIFILLITAASFGELFYRYHGAMEPLPATPMHGALLIATFLAGVSIYFYRDVLPWTPALGATAGALSFALLGLVPYGDFLSPIPTAYFTVYLGLLNPDRRLLRGADYSYGIYLYGFAVQQAVVCLVPEARMWLVNLLISTPIIVTVAAISWHYVERPALNLRSILRRLEAVYLARRERQTATSAVMLGQD